MCGGLNDPPNRPRRNAYSEGGAAAAAGGAGPQMRMTSRSAGYVFRIVSHRSRASSL